MTKLRDNPRGWTTEKTLAPEFDRAAFQKSLDEITGGVVRLVWGAEEEKEVPEGIDSSGRGFGMHKVCRYQTRVKGKTGTVRINRWILEQYQPPEDLGIEDAFIRVPGRGGLYLSPELAEWKREGKWTPFEYIADHSKCPKEICASTEYFCFGDYREPGEFDLNELRKQKRESVKDNPLDAEYIDDEEETF